MRSSIFAFSLAAFAGLALAASAQDQTAPQAQPQDGHAAFQASLRQRFANLLFDGAKPRRPPLLRGWRTRTSSPTPARPSWPVGEATCISMGKCMVSPAGPSKFDSAFFIFRSGHRPAWCRGRRDSGETPDSPPPSSPRSWPPRCRCRRRRWRRHGPCAGPAGGDAGDVGHHRLVHVRADVIGRGLLVAAADLADHHDAFGLRILAGNSSSTSMNSVPLTGSPPMPTQVALAEPAAGRLAHRFVGQCARARDDARPRRVLWM